MLFQTYDAPIVDLSTHDILLESYWAVGYAIRLAGVTRRDQ